MSREEEEVLKAELKRKSVDYTRPILFARFRDCPILRSDDGTKLWVAPHLQARDDGKFGALPAKAQSVRPGTWRYSSSTHHHRRQKNKECLAVECSRWHMHRFFRSGTPCSARVRARNEEIWVHYAFKFEPEREARGGYAPMMGIDRGEAVTAAYAVLDSTGGVLDQGSSADEKLRRRLKRIDEEIRERNRQGAPVSGLYRKRRKYLEHALHRIANQIVDTAHRHNAAISFENLENLRGNGRGGRLTRRQFHRLMKWVQYKAEERGIRADVSVRAAYTSRTCPECGHCEKDNRPTRGRFVCQSCGHEAHADINAGRIIATKALWQINGKREGTGCQNLSDYIQMLTHRRTEATPARSWQVSSPSSDASGST
jgi:IS605 OrfB family transposase